MSFEVGQKVTRVFPRFAKRRVNKKLIRAVVEKVTRRGVITALETVQGTPMARVRYVGGAVNWEPLDMLGALK